MLTGLHDEYKLYVEIIDTSGINNFYNGVLEQRA